MRKKNKSSSIIVIVLLIMILLVLLYKTFFSKQDFNSNKNVTNKKGNTTIEENTKDKKDLI